jgi:hypothetical protein
MLTKIALSTLAVAMSAAAGLTLASADSLRTAPSTTDEAVYSPIQNISYRLGSKAAIGYFAQQAGECHVALMVAEAIDPDVATPPSAARLRLALRPGQVAGFDSEEGPFIDMTCGPDAGSLIVRRGDPTLKAVASQ